MSRKLKIDVEPLSEARWKKVDDAVFRALDSGVINNADGDGDAADANVGDEDKRRPIWTRRRVVTVLVAASLAAAAVIGGIYTRRPSSSTLEANGNAMTRPSHIETGAARSNVELGFASIDVGPSSAITTSGDDAHGVVLVLEHGSVECEVAPRAGRPPFVVQSGDVRIRVVGTHFVVRRDDHTSVEVKHGTVEVTHDGTQTAVHAGEMWPMPSSPDSSSLSPSSVNVLTPSPSSSSSSIRTMAWPPPAMSDQQQYEQAARLEARDPDGATAIYARLAAKSGPWSANALFAEGRLASEKGRSADAKRLLSQYLERYPSGPNAEDARRLLSALR